MKYTITLAEEQGKPNQLDVGGNFLAVATTANVIKLWDLSRREAKQFSPGRVFEGGYDQADVLTMSHSLSREISSIRCNANGTMVSVIASKHGAGTHALRL